MKIDASALADQLPNKDKLFVRLCLAHNDFREAYHASDLLLDWISENGTPRHFDPKFVAPASSVLTRSCFETSMAVTYARPFNRANGLPELGFRRIGLDPKKSTKELHEKIIESRKGYFAHSDPEVRRFFRPTIEPLQSASGEQLARLSNPVFPHGGAFDEVQVNLIQVVVFELQNAVRKVMVEMAEAFRSELGGLISLIPQDEPKSE
ncbi:hypothetical protein MWU54_13690 [Marivita sp. S6314]|uniref:hypothetical protein n=1 Tax=Marivita sp. S6314 TaxID=2926406 RepID=UPI001FF45FCB|nr:hypothetical protein [Marivita sp. S6314]MCK0151088.1 hypothetical protein [Marivita sp. S6314]